MARRVTEGWTPVEGYWSWRKEGRRIKVSNQKQSEDRRVTGCHPPKVEAGKQCQNQVWLWYQLELEHPTQNQLAMAGVAPWSYILSTKSLNFLCEIIISTTTMSSHVGHVSRMCLMVFKAHSFMCLRWTQHPNWSVHTIVTQNPTENCKIFFV